MENQGFYWSRLKGFFEQSIKSRRKLLLELPLGLSDEDFLKLDKGLLLKDADRMSENVIGLFSLPLSIAPNFIIDKTPAIVPMITEEPSVVAAASKMAKIIAFAGGFSTEVSPSLMKGQIQLYGFSDSDKLLAELAAKKSELMDFADNFLLSLKRRGGGIKDIGWRLITAKKPMLLLEPLIDVVDAMGANIINTFLEGLSTYISNLLDVDIGIRVLSNLADQRLAKASCAIPVKLLASDNALDNGYIIAQKMLLAHDLAEADPYRAATHNKGILNGIDAVALATGNDFRALEAGAHAYAAQNGCYMPLTSINLKNDLLCAELKMPIACGVVGGISSIHSGVGLSLRMLGIFGRSAKGLSSVMVSVGLAQCLAAIYALCTEGIQKGHMKLHKKKIFSGLK